jgi:hypothetical protein
MGIGYAIWIHEGGEHGGAKRNPRVGPLYKFGVLGTGAITNLHCGGLLQRPSSSVPQAMA